tara:strand:- start:329 stop:445 length:117 start_codon:yes stop_codon:yes gene_type:complete
MKDINMLRRMISSRRIVKEVKEHGSRYMRKVYGMELIL